MISILGVGLAVAQKSPRESSPDRISVIDTIDGNYIFRGSAPITLENGHNIFAYDGLTALMNSSLETKGLSKLKDYYLISISLLDLNEFNLLKTEKEFFATHLNLGELQTTSLIRLSLLIEHLPEIPFVTAALTDNYNDWLTERLIEIRELANIKRDKPTVIFIHCYAGRDRTGMLISQYRLLFDKTKTLTKINEESVKDSGRQSKNFYNRATQSYCNYLNKYFHKSLTCT